MGKPNLISLNEWEIVEKDMFHEMDYLSRHFDDFTISELYYAIQILDGEAVAVDTFVKNIYGSTAKSEAVEKWREKRSELENRIMDMRISIA